jgi:hypothetical protein
MQLPRLRIWILMAAVAFAALGSAAWVLIHRSRQYANLAAMHETLERTHRRYLAAVERKAQEVGSVLEFNTAVRQGPGARLFGAADEFESEKQALDASIRKYRQLAENERLIASAYRRASRSPWLGAPRGNAGGE